MLVGEEHYYCGDYEKALAYVTVGYCYYYGDDGVSHL